MKYWIAAATLFFAISAPALADENGEMPDIIAQCAACHGVDGIAKSADVPHLASQQEMYLLNQLKAFKSGRRPHKEMRVMSRQLSDAEIAEIAHLYAHMPR